MSTSICTSCLARLRLSGNTTSSLAAASRIPSTSTSFHTSAQLQNVVKKKSVAAAGARAPKLRESRSARIKKKGKERPKPPAIGQRAMERKRIVLSNTNALPVQDLENLTAENMADPSKTGHVLALDGPLLDQLREAKAFKTTQNWNLFRAPSTLIRQESTELAADIEAVNKSRNGAGPAASVHKLVLGDKASGKSIHLVQAMSMAYLNKWVVINIPDCQEFVINNSAYAPAKKDANEPSSEQLYNHPQLAADLLTRVVHSNADVLTKLKLNHTHSKTITDAKPKTLHALAKLGADNRAMAPSAWKALWKELTEPVEKATARPPVLVAIDGINFWMGETKYKSAEYDSVHAHQFTLIKQFLSLLFAKNSEALGYGGMIIAATTKSNHPITPAFDLVARQVQAKQQGIAMTDPQFPLGDPYTKQPDARVAALFDPACKTTIANLKGLSRPESKGLLEYFAKSGIFRDVVDDTAVSEKWTMSGGGIIGELCKLSARSRTSMFPTSNMEGVPIRG